MAEWMQAAGVSASRTVVLVPYAQLMAPARQAWARFHPTGFAPRFESSRNWAEGLMPFAPGPMDWSRGHGPGFSWWRRRWWTGSPGRARMLAMRSALAARLLEATRSLVPRAASIAPDERSAWGQSRLEAMGPGLQSPVWEGLIVTLAVTWACNSAYATDVLWVPRRLLVQVADALVVLEGFQADPLATALTGRWGAAALTQLALA